ncbi:MAG: FtsQ-type POTRA domain-containing protein [Acidobacteriota bacterium]|nr:FtsQ-type POTRA domain-containing protein [Acidobacteriota bacterium]
MSVKVPTEKNFRRAKTVKPVKKKGSGRSLPWRAVTLAGVGVLGLYSTYRALDLVVHASTLQVRKISVLGNVRLSSAEVQALVDGLRGTSILTADLPQYRARLMESPWIADVAMRRILPSTVEVFVSERRPVGLCTLGSQLFLVDRSGVPIDEFGPQYADAKFNLPIITGALRVPSTGEPAIDEQRIDLAARVIDGLAGRKDLADLISEIDVSNRHNAVVMLENDPALLHLGEEKFMERLHSYIELAPTLRQTVPDIEYVDLRFDDRIYVRPTGSTVTQVASRPSAGN